VDWRCSQGDGPRHNRKEQAMLATATITRERRELVRIVKAGIADFEDSVQNDPRFRRDCLTKPLSTYRIHHERVYQEVKAAASEDREPHFTGDMELYFDRLVYDGLNAV